MGFCDPGKSARVWRYIRRAVESGEIDYSELESATGLTRTALHQRVRRLRIKTGLPRPRNLGQLGARNHNAKLTEAEVVTLRKLYRNGLATQAELAAEFGINQANVSEIIRRTQWGHVA